MIEEVKPDNSAAQSPSETTGTTAETPPEPAERPTRPRKQGRTASQRPRSASPPPSPPEGAPGQAGDGLDKYGEEMADQIRDAAAGRRPPFTQNLRGDPDEIPPEDLDEDQERGGPLGGERIIGRHQDRGPVSLLPRPLEFNMKPDQFFKYWAMVALNQEHKDRVKVRPYRLWPITDVNLRLTEEQQEQIARKQRKPPSKTLPPGALKEPFDPQHWREHVYHNYGAGDYNFILTDTHPAVHRTICMTNIIGELRDMDTYPPGVDPRILVMTDPGNESYIRWARTKNIRLIGDDNEEDNDVAASTKILADTVRDLSRGTQQQQQRAESSAFGEIFKTATQSMADSQKAQTDALLKQMEQQRNQTDPIEYHKRVMETAKELMPQQNNGGNLEAIVKMITESNEKRDQIYREANEKRETAAADSNKTILTLVMGNQKALEERLAAAEKRANDLMDKMLQNQVQKPAEQNSGMPRTPMDAFSEVSKMMGSVLSFVDRLSDRQPRGGDGGSIWARIADKVVDVAPNVMYNYSLAQRAAAAVRGANLPEPQPPAQPGEETEEQTEGPPTDEELAQRLLDNLEQPLLHCLNTGATGQEFGALMMKTFGADTYEFIASQSDDALFAFLRNNPNIWATAQRMSTRFVHFLKEFRDRDQVQRIFQQMNVLGQQAAPGHQAPPPQPPHRPQPRSAESAGAGAGGGAGAGPAAAPGAGDGIPPQVSRRLKPGQRVVHTPHGQQVVDAESTVVPEGAPQAQAPPQPPQAPPPPPPEHGSDSAASV